MLKRWWAYLFGQRVYWCRFGHHWTGEPLPIDVPNVETTRWFCSVCFWRWLEE